MTQDELVQRTRAFIAVVCAEYRTESECAERLKHSGAFQRYVVRRRREADRLAKALLKFQEGLKILEEKP